MYGWVRLLVDFNSFTLKVNSGGERIIDEVFRENIAVCSLISLVNLRDVLTTWGMKRTPPSAAVENLGQWVQPEPALCGDERLKTEEGYGSRKVYSRVKILILYLRRTPG